MDGEVYDGLGCSLSRHSSFSGSRSRRVALLGPSMGKTTLGTKAYGRGVGRGGPGGSRHAGR